MSSFALSRLLPSWFSHPKPAPSSEVMEAQGMHLVSMMNDSCYLAITFLSSHHKHLLLIISVSSTNSSSSSDVTTDSNPDDSPVMNKTPNPTMEEVKEW